MDKFYAKDTNFLLEGPSDLTIKRILAFSKAMKNTVNSTPQKEEKQS
jgi:hypothetical protein